MKVEEGALGQEQRLGLKSVNGREGRVKFIGRLRGNELQLD